MKQFTLVIFQLFITQYIFAQPPADKGYTLLFDENFKGNHLNEQDWRCRIDRRTGFGCMVGLNRKDNVFVKDGASHVVINHDFFKYFFICTILKVYHE